MHPARLVLAAAALSLPLGSALAADVLMPGRYTAVRSGSLARFIAKPTNRAETFPVPAPGGPGDPTTGGAELRVFDTGGAAGADTYVLPAVRWQGLGSPAGAKGYRYRGTGQPDDPCRVVVVKATSVKAFCRGSGVTLSPPFAGDEGIVLQLGAADRYCARFGGTTIRNDENLFKRRLAPAPTACPAPGAGTTSTTLGGGTSTSTTLGGGTSTTSTIGGGTSTTSTVGGGVSTTSTSVGGGTSTTTTTIGGGPSTTTSSIGGGSTTTTSVTSTTATTVAGPCCGGDGYLSFTNGVGSGACGELLRTDGTTFDTVDCGGLYFGGGQNSVPLPAVTPDLAQSVTRITACVGQTATLGPTTSAETGSNLNCTDIGCFFGGPLPIPNPGSTPTSTCVINTVAAPASGTADCAAGTQQVDLPLDSEIFLVGDSLPVTPGIQPCPLCTGGDPGTPDSGVCEGGVANGQPCTPQNTAQNPSYPTSHDCPPLLNLSIGTLPIGFALDTGTVSWTGTPSPNPASESQIRVFCGYCRDGDTLAFQNPFRQCWENGEAVGGPCTFGGNPVCQQRDHGAFGPNGGGVKTITTIGAASGSIVDGLPHPQTLVSVFCIPPTFNATVDASANLPGPGAVALEGQVELCATASPCP